MKNIISKLIILSGFMFVLSLGMLSDAKAQTFKDVGSNNPNKTKIESLVDKGVISGYTDGTFRPAEKVTRGQFAAFVARALKLPKATPKFKDVSSSNSLYKEIGSASKAGIISGYSDGTFRPNAIVERQHMAIMLNKALQHYGRYTNQATLSYSDKNSIGAASLSSIKVMTAYGIMGAVSNNKFEPYTYGTRESTVVSIYNMLSVAGQIESVPVDASKKDSQLTYAELKAKYGTQNLIRRDYTDGSFEYMDLIQSYVNFYADYMDSFTEYLHESVFFQNNIPNYELYFPQYEMISYNGRSFVDSPIWANKTRESDYIVPNILPFNPKDEGQYLVDIHTNSKDFAVYFKNTVKTHSMNILPYEKGDVWFVEANTVFQDITTIKLGSSPNQINANGKTITLSNGTETKNGHLMVPMFEVAEKLGLDTRKLNAMYYKVPSMDILRIANFQLAEDY